MRRALLIIAALGIVVSACRAEANVIVDFIGDGSADVTVEFGVDEELQNLIDSFAGDGGIEDLGLVPEGAGEIQTRQVADMTFYYSTQKVEDASTLPDLLADFEATDVEFEKLVIDVGEDSGRFEAEVIVPSIAEATQGLPIAGFAEDAITSNLFIRMPGEPDIEETNADSIAEDGTMQWELPLDGGTLNVVAVTTSDSVFDLPWVLIGSAVIILAILALVLLSNRRKQRREQEALSSVAAPPAPESITRVADS